jgi:hypothetical protein
VTVNPADKTYRFTHDYYLLKHLSHFVDVGARFLKVSGTFDDALAFRNPDQSVIVMLRNQSAQPQRIQVDLAGRAAEIGDAPGFDRHICGTNPMTARSKHIRAARNAPWRIPCGISCS